MTRALPLLVMLLTACGGAGSTDAGSASDGGGGSDSGTPTATMDLDAGGPATIQGAVAGHSFGASLQAMVDSSNQLQIADAPIRCTRQGVTIGSTCANVFVGVTGNLSSGTFTVTNVSSPTGGQASASLSLCADGGSLFQSGTAGTIVYDSIASQVASGHFSVQFFDAGTLTGTFSAPICTPH